MLPPAVLSTGGMYHGDLTDKLKALYKLHLPPGEAHPQTPRVFKQVAAFHPCCGYWVSGHMIYLGSPMQERGGSLWGLGLGWDTGSGVLLVNSIFFESILFFFPSIDQQSLFDLGVFYCLGGHIQCASMLRDHFLVGFGEPYMVMGSNPG